MRATKMTSLSAPIGSSQGRFTISPSIATLQPSSSDSGNAGKRAAHRGDHVAEVARLRVRSRGSRP